jgi:hypothetical protein
MLRHVRSQESGPPYNAHAGEANAFDIIFLIFAGIQGKDHLAEMVIEEASFSRPGGDRYIDQREG